MARLSPKRKPTFVWQALLIVLPVIVLAAMGLFSLRQDKILAQHEATERAQAVADELAEKMWTELTGARDTNALAFKIDQAGQLIFPQPYSPVPVPEPFKLAELNAEQLRFWQSAEALGQEQTITSRVQALREFVALSPPERFEAAALFNLGLLLTKQGSESQAIEVLKSIIGHYPRALGESGLPLAPLA